MSGEASSSNQTSETGSTLKILKELFCIFLCPPFPSRIAEKLAFYPPECTYSLLPDESGRYTIKLTEKAEWQYTEAEQKCIEAYLVTTSKGNKIGCCYLKCVTKPRYTILFSHGNAADLGQMTSFYYELGKLLNCNIVGYDYSGYGVSTGKPSEKNLYADIEAVWHSMGQRYNLKPDKIILYGQSIGTVPTVDLASRLQAAAVVLHSPLMSGLRLAFPDTKKTWFFDVFPSIDKVPNIKCPVLVIHGIEDEVISFKHGINIFTKCPRTFAPLWIEGAGHNDIILHRVYFERMLQFVNTDVPNSVLNYQNQ